jgi:hypothetical protein
MCRWNDQGDILVRLLTTVCSVMLWATLASADWQGIKWGTTVESFLEASGGRSTSAGTTLVLYKPYRAGSLVSTAALKYRFDPKEVARLFEVYVNFLGSQSGSCQDLEKHLLSKYGAPLKQEVKSDSRTVKWSDNNGGNNLEFTQFLTLWYLKYLPLEKAQFIGIESSDWQSTEWPTTIKAFINASGGGSALVEKQLTVERSYQTGSLVFTEQLKFQFDPRAVARLYQVYLVRIPH